MRIAGVGHRFFAATLIALGVLGVITRDFAPIWNSVPDSLPAREALAWLCTFVCLGCGIGLLWQRAEAARVLFVYLFVWMLLIKVRIIFLAPAEEVSYQSCGETAVLVSGAWVLYARFANDWDRRRLAFLVDDAGVRMARVLYALALIAFGLSHFAYVDLTAPLVPAWLPAHLFWAYFTGCTYLAAGAAMLTGVCARLAAALSALQMALFLLLIWVPIVAAGNVSSTQWIETVVNWALIAGAWVVADSYQGTPWFVAGRRVAKDTA